LTGTVKQARSADEIGALIDKLSTSIERAILGKRDVIDRVLTALLSRGHLLIEDIPGVGKTTMAQALARSINCSFKRVQFTSDLLPSDILGVKVFEPASGEFKFVQGPIFNSIVLADEINRTTPRTQSAFLEAMSEAQVTIEGDTFSLPAPFMVIATENPIEHHGTYALPDSQLDRFLMSVSMGYPPRDDEKRILTENVLDPSGESFGHVMEADEVVALQSAVDGVRLSSEVADYILELVGATRQSKGLRLGASPRGSLALRQVAKASALMDGRDFTIPDDVKKNTVSVLAHRVIPSGAIPPDEKRKVAKDIVEDIVETVSAPL